MRRAVRARQASSATLVRTGVWPSGLAGGLMPVVPVAVSCDDDGVVVVAGEIDLSVVPALRDAVHGWCPPGRPLVVDLSGVSFMDSSGLSLLLALWERAGGSQEALVVRAASDQVHQLLQLTGVLELFRVMAPEPGAAWVGGQG